MTFGKSLPSFSVLVYFRSLQTFSLKGHSVSVVCSVGHFVSATDTQRCVVSPGLCDSCEISVRDVPCAEPCQVFNSPEFLVKLKIMIKRRWKSGSKDEVFTLRVALSLQFQKRGFISRFSVFFGIICKYRLFSFWLDVFTMSMLYPWPENGHVWICVVISPNCMIFFNVKSVVSQGKFWGKNFSRNLSFVLTKRESPWGEKMLLFFFNHYHQGHGVLCYTVSCKSEAPCQILGT